MVKQDFKENVNEPLCHIAVFYPQPRHNMYRFVRQRFAKQRAATVKKGNPQGKKSFPNTIY